MLLTETARIAIVASGATVALSALVVLIKLRRTNKLPAARVGNTRLGTAKPVAAALLVIALAVAGWAAAHTIPVLVVEDGRSGYGSRVIRKNLLARSLEDFAIAPGGNRDRGAWVPDPCWVVNRSSRPVHKMVVNYAYNPRVDPPRPRGGPQYRITKDVLIAPNARASSCVLDYIGPTLAPPDRFDGLAHTLTGVVFWLSWADADDTVGETKSR